jgi:predicted RNA-binding protein Jag
MQKEIEQFAFEFFDKMGILIDSLIVKQEQDESYFIKINTLESSLLIWTHWTTFEALQWLFRTILSIRFDKKIKLHLEINDYIHNKDAKLFAFIDKEILRAKQTGRNMKLPFFNGYERKKIHSYVQSLEDSSIKTESRGEGEDRRLFIVHVRDTEVIPKIKATKLEIDIDWDDI